MSKEKQIFKGSFLNAFINTVEFPNGYQGNVEFIKHPGAVLIVPELRDGSMVLIRQFRPVIGRFIWEFPAGTLEANENPLMCARRELIEETGYKAKLFKKLGFIFPVPGYSTEKIIIYKARGLSRVARNLMEDEVIDEKVFSRKEVFELVKKRKIIDAKTICALSFMSF